MEGDVEAQFRPFRRYCIMLTSQPSLPVLEKLKETVLQSNGTSLNAVQEYIMLPMQMYLRAPNMPENYTLSVLLFVRDFYHIVKLSSKFVLTDLIQSILPFLTPTNFQTKSTDASEGTRSTISEDMKIALCSCLKSLVRSADDTIKCEVLYNQEYKLQVSHLVFQALEWSEADDVTEVVIESLQFVNELCYNKCISDLNMKKPQYGVFDTEIAQNFASQFTQMLPGLTSRILKVIKPKKLSKSDKIQSHKIKANALMVWCNYVCALLNDKHFNRDDIMDTDEGIEDASNIDNGHVNMINNPTWLGKAQDHLVQHLEILRSHNFVTSEKLYLRNMVYLICEATSEFCKNTLRCFNSLQIEILAGLCVDDEPDLAERANICMQHLINDKRPIFLSGAEENYLHLSNTLESNEIRNIVELAQSKLFDICDSIIQSTFGLYEEIELNQKLCLLHGFLVLLKNIEASSTFFHSETYLTKLLDALLLIVTLDENHLIGDNILNDYTNFEFIFAPELYLKFGRQQKAFKYLSSNKLRNRVISIARIISKYASLNLVIDHLRSNILPTNDIDENEVRSMVNYRRETIYLLNEMSLGLDIDPNSDTSQKNIGEALDTLIETYLNFEKSRYKKYSTSTEIVSLNAAKPNLATKESEYDWSDKCLIIEGLGILALGAQRCNLISQFKDNYLGEVLVFILSETDLSKSHSANVLYHSLKDLSAANGFVDIASMLRENLDYICRELAVLLRKYLSASSKFKQKSSIRPEGLPTLLKAVLKIQDLQCQTISDLPELRDTIEVLLHQLDLSWIDPDKSVTTEILQVINIFTKAFVEQNQSPNCKATSNKTELEDNFEKGVVTKLLQNLMSSDEIQKKFLEDDMDEIHCPETGFHTDIQDENVSYDTENEEIKVVSDKTKFLRKTIQHSRHFISMVNCPQWQLLSIGKIIQKYKGF